MCMLNVSGVSRLFGEKPVLDDVSFSQEKLQKIAVSGETGSGKSTLMKIIAGLDQADRGTVVFEGKKVKGINEKMMPGHTGIAYLSQYHELRNNYRVVELLDYANSLSRKKSVELYAMCRIEHLLFRWTDQLSGGEKQRVALAVLLTTCPRFLVLDEPFSNLDPIHKELLKKAIRDVSEEFQLTCLLASHDPSDALPWADKIIVLRQGSVVQSDSPRDIYYTPADAYVAGLFGACNLIPASLLGDYGMSAVSAADKRLVLIRPEHFRIVPAGAGAIPATVAGIAFLGSSYEVEVVIANGFFIRLRMDDAGLSAGDSVCLTCDDEHIHYLGV